MQENFRQFLERLRTENEMADVRQPVDIRHIATLVDQSDKALFFHNVIGYDIPVVSGIIRTQKRAVLSMGCTSYGEIEHKLQQGIDHPIAVAEETFPPSSRRWSAA
jgi:2,5-furandicarboxylate decarboxylase 1